MIIMIYYCWNRDLIWVSINEGVDLKKCMVAYFFQELDNFTVNEWEDGTGEPLFFSVSPPPSLDSF